MLFRAMLECAPAGAKFRGKTTQKQLNRSKLLQRKPVANRLDEAQVRSYHEQEEKPLSVGSLESRVCPGVMEAYVRSPKLPPLVFEAQRSHRKKLGCRRCRRNGLANAPFPLPILCPRTAWSLWSRRLPTWATWRSATRPRGCSCCRLSP